MVEVRRDHWRSSCPNALLKQGHREPVAQCPVKRAFERVPGRRLHNLSGQPLPLRGHPHWEKRFPHVQTEPPVLQIVPVAPRPDSGFVLLFLNTFTFCCFALKWWLNFQAQLECGKNRRELFTLAWMFLSFLSTLECYSAKNTPCFWSNLEQFSTLLAWILNPN